MIGSPSASGIYAGTLFVSTDVLELYAAVDECKERMVPPQTDVVARLNPGAPQSDEGRHAEDPREILEVMLSIVRSVCLTRPIRHSYSGAAGPWNEQSPPCQGCLLL